MCEYCGCREVQPVGELMDEHAALMDEAAHVRQALTSGETSLAMERLTRLADHLGRHVRREEAGIFSALRDKGEFLHELGELEAEHRQFDAVVAGLDPDSADFAAVLTRLFDDLGVHVEREDLGIFPVSVVTLGAFGWEMVEKAHTESPTFLLDHAAPGDDRQRE
jgi:hemerythrin-like domain-containing protein